MTLLFWLWSPLVFGTFFRALFFLEWDSRIHSVTQEWDQQWANNEKTWESVGRIFKSK